MSINLLVLAIIVVVVIGGWLEQFGWGIGLLAGLWYFFTGGSLPWDG